MKILLATTNKGKVKELSSLLNGVCSDFLLLDSFDLKEPVEDGLTFEDNAIIKAEYYCDKTKLPCISDDSGLVIPVINNMPGIYSARWAGVNKDFSLAIKKVYNELLHIGVDFRNDSVDAFFYCSIAYKVPGHDVKVFSGSINGSISSVPKGKNGFGYDPIFIPDNSLVTYGEMTIFDKSLDNHRLRAIKKLTNYIISCNKDT